MARHLRLPPRQQATIELKLRGLSDAEVARELRVTEHAVRANVRRSYQRIGVGSALELCRAVVARWRDAP